MRRGKVALVIDSLGSGGAQRQLAELAVGLHRRTAWSPFVVTYHADSFFRPRLETEGVPLLPVLRRGRFDPTFPWRLAGALRGADVVHAFLLTPSFWSAISRTLISGGPALIAAERNSRIAETLAERLLQAFVYRRCDAVTTNVEPVRALIHERLGVPESRIHYLPNAIDLATWDADAARPCEIEIEAGHFHVALIGGLRPQKNHALLFDALARIPEETRANWRVWCVGGETAGAEAARSVREALGARGIANVVRIVPPIVNVAALMTRIDAIVLTSAYEGFPNVLLEAQASGIPVVTTRVGDVANLVVDGESGFIVESSPEAVAAALTRIAELPRDRRQALGARGRAIVAERFDLDASAARHEALYARVLAEKRGA